MSTPLTDAINALTTYANGITGKSDTTLPDAVRSLADGYGGGSVEEETGTYTPSTDELPIINFANSHSKAPDIIVFADVSENTATIGNTIIFFQYVNIVSFLGVPWTSLSDISKAYAYGRLTSSLAAGSGFATYTRNEVTSSGFRPFAGTTAFLCRTGQTYKWIAIWR